MADDTQRDRGAEASAKTSSLMKKQLIMNDRDKPVSLSDVQVFIDQQKKANTKRATNRHVKNIQRWLAVNKFELRPLFLVEPELLDEYLSQLYISIRKADGGEYEPGSLDQLRASLERHLLDNKYQTSLRDRIFHKSNEALKAKKIALKKQGKGRKANASEAISADEENKMWENGQLGDSSPEILIFSIWYYFTKGFGLRGRDEHRKLQYGDITLKHDVNDREYLEYAERDSKTMDGSKTDDYRPTVPRIYATQNNRDPIRLYKSYVSHRPIEACDDACPFYLTCIPKARIKPEDLEWFYRTPMGINKLGQLMKTAAKNTGMQGKKTNHGVRKTVIKTLTKAKVPAQN